MFRGQLEDMVMVLWAYINPQSVDCGKWMAASLRTVNNMNRAPSKKYSSHRVLPESIIMELDEANIA